MTTRTSLAFARIPALTAGLCLLAAGRPVLAADPAAVDPFDDEPAGLSTAQPEPTPAVSPSPVPSPRPTGTADAPVPPTPDPRGAKRVRNFGIGSLALGAVMIGVGAGLEHKRRTDICKETLSDDHGKACDDSKMANITVLAMGVTFLVGGAVLTGLGQARLNQAKRAQASSRFAVSPQVARGFGGAVFTARF